MLFLQQVKMICLLQDFFCADIFGFEKQSEENSVDIRWVHIKDKGCCISILRWGYATAF